MKRVLVLDDHEEIRIVIREFLQSADYEVDDAATTDAALAIHRTKPVDLLITDICMPDKNGLVAIQDFLAHDPAPKIIAISGGPSAADDADDVYHDLLREAKSLGAHKILHKPFQRHDLLALIDTLLQPE